MNNPEFGLILFDAERRITGWSRGAEGLLGYSAADVAGKSWDSLLIPQFAAADPDFRSLASGTRTFLHKSGLELQLSVVIDALPDSNGQPSHLSALVVRDMPREAEVVERVYHRIRNDLQTIVSLMGIQLISLRPADALEAFTAMKSRIQAIAALYERSFVGPGAQEVDLKPLLAAVADCVREAWPLQQTVIVARDVSSLRIAEDRALPLVLIAYELLSNALRHAHPENANATVDLRLELLNGEQQQNQNRAMLQVVDDGCGLPSGVTPHTGESFGFQLIRMLCRQIDGSLQCQTSSAGTRIAIEFTIL